MIEFDIECDEEFVASCKWPVLPRIGEKICVNTFQYTVIDITYINVEGGEGCSILVDVNVK